MCPRRYGAGVVPVSRAGRASRRRWRAASGRRRPSATAPIAAPMTTLLTRRAAAASAPSSALRAPARTPPGTAFGPAPGAPGQESCNGSAARRAGSTWRRPTRSRSTRGRQRRPGRAERRCLGGRLKGSFSWAFPSAVDVDEAEFGQQVEAELVEVGVVDRAMAQTARGGRGADPGRACRRWCALGLRRRTSGVFSVLTRQRRRKPFAEVARPHRLTASTSD